jgi:hypothetical protein
VSNTGKELVRNGLNVLLYDVQVVKYQLKKMADVIELFVVNVKKVFSGSNQLHLMKMML